MSATTATTLILVVAILCLTGYAIIRLLLGRGLGGVGNGFGNLAMLVLGRSGEGTNWEPFIVAPGPHSHEPHDHPHNHDIEIEEALANHVNQAHGPHSHPDLATTRQLHNLQNQIDQLNRRIRRMRIRAASDYPFEVIGAVIGAVIGIIVDLLIPSRWYSYPTKTYVTVNGSATTVSHQLAQDHWVLGGVIVAGLLIGLVIGLALKYVFGRTEVALEVQP